MKFSILRQPVALVLLNFFVLFFARLEFKGENSTYVILQNVPASGHL